MSEHKYKKIFNGILFVALIALLMIPLGQKAKTVLGALDVLRASQGGTGIGTATVGDVGDCLTVSDDSPFTYALGTCGSGGGGGGSKWATSTADSTAIHTSGATKVGIGTTSPYTALAVVGEVVATNFTATTTTRAGFSSAIGSVSIPAYSFNSDTDTGMWSSGSNNLNFSAGGAEVLRIVSNFIQTNQPMGGNENGAYYVRNSSITESAPAYSFLGDTNNGIYSPAADTIGFTTDGTRKVTLTSTGNFGIGTTSPYAKLSVVGEVVASHFTATSTVATSTFAYDASISGRLRVLQPTTNAVIIGDTSGNARGSGALDIQSGRNVGTAVASGVNSVAVGTRNTVAGTQASGFGFANECTGDNTLCMGYVNVASGLVNAAIGTDNSSTGIEGSSAIGVSNIASSFAGSAFGYGNTAAGDDYSSAFGIQNASNASFCSTFGQTNTCSGDFGVAFGYSNTTSAVGAVALGASINNSITGSLQIGPSDTAKNTILSSGFTGIGTTSPYAKLTVWGSGTGTGKLFEAANSASTSQMELLDNGDLFLRGLTAAAGTPSSICMNAATNEITVNAALTCTVSSQDFKDGIDHVSPGINTLMALVPTGFLYTDDLQRERLGFIAEEVVKADERLGDAFEDGKPKSIDLSAILAVAVQSIKDVWVKVMNHESRIEKLESENEMLIKRIEQLEKNI